MQSLVETTSHKSQATVVLDSAFTLPQMPREIVDAIYGRFRDSEYQRTTGIGGAYVLPCAQEINITFHFAGRPYPFHPLGMSLDPSKIGFDDMRTAKGEKAYIGTFQPFSYERGASPSSDMVLGMMFLRNAYALFDYGDFTPKALRMSQSYIKLLSTTDRATPHLVHDQNLTRFDHPALITYSTLRSRTSLPGWYWHDGQQNPQVVQLVEQ